MKVFISWSGERSRQVGELLDEWLQCVIQAINPWRSDRDIDRGSLWFTQITSQLQETSIGIVCITQDNKNNPWILFETGALAKGLSTSRVCTFLIDLQPSDIKDPLAQFNHTLPNESGLKNLVRTLNSALGEKCLPEKVLNEVFETYWPKFEEKFNALLEQTNTPITIEPRSENDILEEVLSITRNMDRRVRNLEFNGNLSVDSEATVLRQKPGIRFGAIQKGNDNTNIDEKIETRIYELVLGNTPKKMIFEILSEEYNISMRKFNLLYNSVVEEYRITTT